MARTLDLPVFRGDLYSDVTIADPYPSYAALRALGPLVWLRKQRVVAIPRYQECREVLADDTAFISGEGVGLNPIVNALSHDTTLNSDGECHAARRTLVGQRLTPRALRSMEDTVRGLAGQTVGRAVAAEYVDGVEDIAQALPLSVVPDLVGWPESGRDNLLPWAAATFDLLGPVNRRGLRATLPGLSMLRYTRRLVSTGDLAPGSLGADLLEAVDAGAVERTRCPALLVDYMAPSLDTTISAIAHALLLFARHPEAWQRLRDQRDLLGSAVNEVIRLESPLRAFARVAATDVELAGTRIPAGTRLLVLYASANRDERFWTDPDTFDIARDATKHLGFGYGVHGCAGQGLARMEIRAVLEALLDRVERIELTGEPEVAANNIIHGLQRLPLRLIKTNRGEHA